MSRIVSVLSYALFEYIDGDNELVNAGRVRTLIYVVISSR